MGAASSHILIRSPRGMRIAEAADLPEHRGALAMTANCVRHSFLDQDPVGTLMSTLHLLTQASVRTMTERRRRPWLG